MDDVAGICLLGFGEAGSKLAEDLSAQGMDLVAWDVAFAKKASRARRNLERRGEVQAATSARRAAVGADLVISAVTAAEDLSAARSVLPGIEPGCWFLDLNSVAPSTKRAVAADVEAAGGRYVEAAIMSPISPKGIASPMLLGGPHAAEFLALAGRLGFTGAEFCEAEIGAASATKMCRSVVIKGMEALLLESLVAARHYGVEGRVVASLGNLLPHPDWQELARYMISRAVEHGTRRAEEMREVATTVRDAGLEPLMSSAAVRRQEGAAGHASGRQCADLGDLLDALAGTSGETGT